MSEAWSKRRDIAPLADGQIDIDFDIPLEEFPRLQSQLSRSEGTARGQVRFRRELGFAVAEVSVSAAPWLVCQRCLEPMRHALDGASRIALVESAAAAEAVPPELDAVIAPDDRVSVRDVVEEELLLGMPIVALHANPAECAAQAPPQPPAEAETERDATQTPFAQLGELLKRDK